MTVEKTKRMLVIELNAAEKHFLDRYVAEGQLPAFEKLLKAGTVIKTRVGAPIEPLTPWTIWPSIYTGIKPDKHGIVGFGQSLHALQGHYIWDALNAKGVTTGVFGNRMSTPISQNSLSFFYVPGVFSASQLCFPSSLSVIQKFFDFIKKNNIRRSVGLALQLFFQLAMGAVKGVPFSIIKTILLQMGVELVKGIPYQKNRAILRAKCQMDIFKALYDQYKPEFSTIHLENIASAQQLYWRAAEPEMFSDELGELDSYYFENVEMRKSHEILFKDIILDNFRLVDEFLGSLLPILDEQTVLVIITGLGQKKRDPVHQIHKPEIRFYNLKQLLNKIDVLNCEILTQANPNITLNFQDTADASLGAFKLSNLNVLGEYPLFKLEQREHQLFLEENLSPTMWALGTDVWMENQSNEMIFPLFDYVKISHLKDQYTADYSSEGWILFYSKELARNALPAGTEQLDVMEIYPLLLSYFNDKIQNLEE
ncbi:MAG TPA: alkaline phosphatase family protein [Gammaproteobacteria bacterium]|nr:alkaline phosphatase family protein [Gammaproteobacteria bacterium]